MKHMSPALNMLVVMLAAFTLTSCQSPDSEKPDGSETSQATVAATSSQKPQNTEGASSELVGPAWFIVEIDGQDVLDESPASVEFLASGKMKGNTSCNSFLGFFGGGDADGKLELDMGAHEMLACTEPLKKQEERFLEMLNKISSYTIKDNILRMQTDDGKTMTARRR